MRVALSLSLVLSVASLVLACVCPTPQDNVDCVELPDLDDDSFSVDGGTPARSLLSDENAYASAHDT